MAKRQRKKLSTTASAKTSGGLYFEDEVEQREYISTGCKVLDCVLGDGWAEGRIVNIVGDFSTGKTLLAIEAGANFRRKYPEGHLRYGEAESAFDKPYARKIGWPRDDNTSFAEDLELVEEFYDDITGWLNDLNGQPGLYILDSLDGLDTKAESEKEFGNDATYGTGKPKKMGQLLRRLKKKLSKSNATLLIVSQTRMKIGVTFGKKWTRSGGKALDFYASQVLWLARQGSVTVTRKKVKRSIGVHIRAKCEKNKVSPEGRECSFPILFDYGVDDVTAAVSFLHEVSRMDLIGGGSKETFLRDMDKLTPKAYAKEQRRLNKAVLKGWREVEKRFKPKRSKYQDV